MFCHLQKSSKFNRDYTNIKYSSTGVGGGDVHNQLSRIGAGSAAVPSAPLTPNTQRAANNKITKQPPP